MSEHLSRHCLLHLPSVDRGHSVWTWEQQKFCLGPSLESVTAAKDKADAAFDLSVKMGLIYFLFHDFLTYSRGATFAESEKRLSNNTGLS